MASAAATMFLANLGNCDFTVEATGFGTGAELCCPLTAPANKTSAAPNPIHSTRFINISSCAMQDPKVTPGSPVQQAYSYRFSNRELEMRKLEMVVGIAGDRTIPTGRS